MNNANANPAELTFSEKAEGLSVSFSGRWTMAVNCPTGEAAIKKIASREGGSLRFEAKDLVDWDTVLLIRVQALSREAESNGWEVNFEALPEGVCRLLELSRSRSANEASEGAEETRLEKIGIEAIRAVSAIKDYFEFLGQLILDILNLARGKGAPRLKDFLFILQQTGPRALAIVCLLSFLTGLIIAFIGVIQLQKFAADIYVADLVGLATTRELAAVMAGVIMAGRTGAAFAAQIGSMKVNEEIDALVSFGISPMQFLVVPRVIALVIMMPLLCAFANLVSILGGMVVAVLISDVTITQYCLQVKEAVGLNDFLVGIFKSGIFGVIIALSGCFKGLFCGKDATAVGLAATSAVVTSITWIVIADAIFAVMFHLLGI